MGQSMKLSYEFVSVLQPWMFSRHTPYTAVGMEVSRLAKSDEGDIIQFVAFTIFSLVRSEALL